jgi:hypothetical protein
MDHRGEEDMNRRTAALPIALALAFAAPALGADSLGVLAVAEPPAGPDAGLAEMAHQLRAACRDRAGGVLGVPEMRARLLGQVSNATLPELERAYAGAQAAFQNEEMEISASTLRAIVEDLENLPESDEAYAQWTRAMIRLAYVERVLKRRVAAAETMERLAATEPRFVVDEILYPPSFRREFEEARRRVAARGKVKLTITSPARQATAFVNGRNVGKTPVALSLPPGRYRVGGATGGLRVPSSPVRLDGEARTVELEFSLAGALRIDAGPGLAFEPKERATGVVRAGGWLGATRVISVSIARDSGAELLAGALYDVQRGALLREGRVRIVSGSVPSVALGALAAFLLTGQPSPGVTAVSTEPVTVLATARSVAAVAGREPLVSTQPAVQRAKPQWMRPAAYAAGAVAIALAGVATWQGLSAHGDYGAANAMLLPDGSLVPGGDQATYDRTIEAANSKKRNAYIGAAGAAAFAIAAGVLGYLSWDDEGKPVVRF